MLGSCCSVVSDPHPQPLVPGRGEVGSTCLCVCAVHRSLRVECESLRGWSCQTLLLASAHRSPD